MERGDNGNLAGARENHAGPLEVAVDQVELGLPVEDVDHRREHVAAGIATETVRAQRLGHCRHETTRHLGIARSERRDLVAAPDKLDDQLVDDALGSTVARGRDALDRRGDLGDSQGSGHRNGPRITLTAGRVRVATGPSRHGLIGRRDHCDARRARYSAGRRSRPYPALPRSLPRPGRRVRRHRPRRRRRRRPRREVHRPRHRGPHR